MFLLKDIQFTLAVVKIKGYFEAFFEQRPTFKLSLIETESEQVVWSTIIREGMISINLQQLTLPVKSAMALQPRLLTG